MAISKIVVSVAAIGLFGAAIAQDQTRVHVEVISDDTAHEAVRIELDSDDMGFNLHDMQEGENQAIVDKQGRTVLVTREADGFTFNVEGKSIKMPLIDGDHGSMMALHGEHSEHDENVEVHVVHDLVKVDGDKNEHHEVKIVKKVEVVSD